MKAIDGESDNDTITTQLRSEIICECRLACRIRTVDAHTQSVGNPAASQLGRESREQMVPTLDHQKHPTGAPCVRPTVESNRRIGDWIASGVALGNRFLLRRGCPWHESQECPICYLLSPMGNLMNQEPVVVFTLTSCPPTGPATKRSSGWRASGRSCTPAIASPTAPAHRALRGVSGCGSGMRGWSAPYLNSTTACSGGLW